MEEWKELPGYNKRYWISNQGRVKSFAWGKELDISLLRLGKMDKPSITWFTDLF
jgi:hypothetical protein